MNLYRNTDGTWVGTKAEAEKGATKTDVPINPKSALIVFLNELNAERREPAGVSEADTETTPPIETDALDVITSVQLDELVRNSPMRRRLSWAVEAIDAADGMMTRMVATLRGTQS